MKYRQLLPYHMGMPAEVISAGFVYVALWGNTVMIFFFLWLSVFLCIYKQTSVSCAASKSSYFWYWRRFNSEHKVLQELSHFSPLPDELWCSDTWSELTRSEVCCIAVITALSEGGDLCSQRISLTGFVAYTDLHYCTLIFSFLHYKFTCKASLFSSTGSVEITEGISLFSQPSPVDKCKEGLMNGTEPPIYQGCGPNSIKNAWIKLFLNASNMLNL